MKPFAAFLQALAGPAIWAAHFFSIYIAEALVCTAPDPSANNMRITALLLTLAALAMLAGIVFSRRDAVAGMGRITEVKEQEFLPLLTLSLAILSALAVIWAAAPAFVMPVCAFAPG